MEEDLLTLLFPFEKLPHLRRIIPYRDLYSLEQIKTKLELMDGRTFDHLAASVVISDDNHQIHLCCGIERRENILYLNGWYDLHRTLKNVEKENVIDGLVTNFNLNSVDGKVIYYNNYYSQVEIGNRIYLIDEYLDPLTIREM